MTFQDYTAEVLRVADTNPHWRLGQAAFNVLYQCRPDLSEQIRATRLDPFHNSDTLTAFYEWTERNWNNGQVTATSEASATTDQATQ